MKFIDFFAGIGGFRRGLELSGHQCVGFCEFDKNAVFSYIAMHLLTDEQWKELKSIPAELRKNGVPNFTKRQKYLSSLIKENEINGEWYASDIRQVRGGGDIPKADCWTFGAPCQDFSIAGKRAGLAGDRSSLIREVFRLLEEQEEQDRPEWLIYENVKGMLSSNKGLDYLSILSEMDRLGYDIEWQNINSKWFVPQNRERIYTIGHHRRFGSRKVFPIEGTGGENRVCQIGMRKSKRTNPNANRVYDPEGIAPCLNTMEGGGREPNIGLPCFVDMNSNAGIKATENARTIQARYYKGIANRACEISGVAIKIIGEVNSPQDGQIHDINGISKCHSAGHGNSPKIAIPVMNPDIVNKKQNGRRIKENEEPMFTLTAQDRHGVGVGVRYTKDGFHLYRNDKKKSSIQGTHITYPDGNVNCLSTTHVPMTMEKIGIIDPQGRNTKEVILKDTCPTLRSETHGNLPDVCIDVSGETPKQGDGIYVEMPEGFTVYAVWYEKYQCYIAIRRLTPKECFRLQGWTDNYFEKAAFVNADSKLYKQAGNGVTVSVIQAIGERMNG